MREFFSYFESPAYGKTTKYLFLWEGSILEMVLWVDIYWLSWYINFYLIDPLADTVLLFASLIGTIDPVCWPLRCVRCAYATGWRVVNYHNKSC